MKTTDRNNSGEAEAATSPEDPASFPENGNPTDPESAAIVARLKKAAKNRTFSGADDSAHLGLAELQTIAEQMKRPDSDGCLPPHLLACPTCLEAYEMIRAGLPKPSDRSIDRFIRETTGARQTRRKIVSSEGADTPREKRHSKQVLAVMTAVLVLAIAIIVSSIWFSSANIRFQITSGNLLTPRLKQSGQAGEIPDGAWIKTANGAEILLADQFPIILGRWTSLRIDRTESDTTLLLRLRCGSLQIRPPTRSAGHRLKIETPFGTIIPKNASLGMMCVSSEGPESRAPSVNELDDAAFNMPISGVLVTVEDGSAELDSINGVQRIGKGEKVRIGEP